MMRGPEMMPVMATIPTGDLVAAGVVAAAVIGAVGLIVRESLKNRQLKRQGASRDDIARYHYWEGFRREHPERPSNEDLSEFR